MPVSTDHKIVHPYPKLLYIMGTARSGTTILEIVLANASNAVGAGELTFFFKDGMLKNLPCSCGKLTADCLVWQNIIRRVKNNGYDAHAAKTVNKTFDRHCGFIRWFFGVQGHKNRQLYNTVNWSVIERLALDNDAEYVIDSSKYAARALYLSRHNPEQVRVICMTRDARGLLASFRKNNIGEQRPRSLLSAAFYIVVVSACLSIARYTLGKRCMTVRYDELCTNPIETLNRIENWAQMDLSHSKKLISENSVLAVGHIITGNRLRKKKDLRFSPDIESAKSKNFVIKVLAYILNIYQEILGIAK